MTTKSKIILLLIALVFVFILVKVVCNMMMSDEDRIRGIITDIAAAAEDEDAAEIAGYIHDDFKTQMFTNKKLLKFGLVRIFMEYSKITATVESVKVKMLLPEEGDSTIRAEATGVARVKFDGALQDFRFNLELRKIENNWLIYRVTRTAVGGQ